MARLSETVVVPAADGQKAVDALNEAGAFNASLGNLAKHPNGWLEIEVEATGDVDDPVPDVLRAFAEGIGDTLDSAGVDRWELRSERG